MDNNDKNYAQIPLIGTNKKSPVLYTRGSMFGYKKEK